MGCYLYFVKLMHIMNGEGNKFSSELWQGLKSFGFCFEILIRLGQIFHHSQSMGENK